jgi:hypothetical protein
MSGLNLSPVLRDQRKSKSALNMSSLYLGVAGLCRLVIGLMFTHMALFHCHKERATITPLLKVTVSRDGYFFKGLNSPFCVCADCFQGLSKAFNFLFLNYLLILEMLTETILRIPFSVIGRCSQVPTSHCLQGKCTIMNLSQAASGMTLQNHRRLPVSNFSVKIAGDWKDFQN